MDKYQPMPLFGAQYLLTLAIALLCVLVICYAFKKKKHFFQRYDIYVVILISVIGILSGLSDSIHEIFWQHQRLVDSLPLALCGFSYTIVLPIALLSANQTWQQMLLYWGIMGAILSYLFPTLSTSVDFEYVRFYVAHGVLFVGGIYAVSVRDLVVKRYTFIKAWLLFQVYVAIMLLFDVIFHANYFFLIAKPIQTTPLNVLGPWPYYFIPCEFIAMAFFFLIGLFARKVLRSGHA